MTFSKIDEVRACIDSSLNSCSQTAINEIELQYTQLVASANVSCVDDFFGCAIKYAHYVIQIIEWKAYVEPETSTTAKPATTTQAAAASTQKSGSVDTKDTDTSGSTSDSESTKSETADSESKRSTGTESTGATGSGTEMTVAEIQNITSNRQETLVILCAQFTAAWQCIQKEWNVLSPSSYELVTTTYTIYHTLVMGICNGRICCDILPQNIDICTYDTINPY